MTDHLKGAVLLLEEGALSPAHHRRILERRDEYERALRKIIRDGIASGVFVRCDPKVVGFAIMGAMNSIPKWYTPAGKRSLKDISETIAVPDQVAGRRCPSRGGPVPAPAPLFDRNTPFSRASSPWHLRCYVTAREGRLTVTR